MFEYRIKPTSSFKQLTLENLIVTKDWVKSEKDIELNSITSNFFEKKSLVKFIPTPVLEVDSSINLEQTQPSIIEIEIEKPTKKKSKKDIEDANTSS